MQMFILKERINVKQKINGPLNFVHEILCGKHAADIFCPIFTTLFEVVRFL